MNTTKTILITSAAWVAIIGIGFLYQVVASEDTPYVINSDEISFSSYYGYSNINELVPLSENEFKKVLDKRLNGAGKIHRFVHGKKEDAQLYVKKALLDENNKTISVLMVKIPK